MQREKSFKLIVKSIIRNISYGFHGRLFICNASLGPIDGKAISSFIPGVLVVAFYPFEECLDFELIPLLDFVQNRFNEILVLNGFVVRSYPVIPPPTLEPLSYTFD